MSAPTVILVSHTHWDREWYRPFEAFRARLVDTVDMVLDQLAADPGWSFLLDGQTVVLEDYLEIRPERRKELEAACRAGRIAIGPWYVQPDSLLPSGETHVRNLVEGRRVGSAIGPVSRAGYTPDSFGHPAQMPHLFAGFGIDTFIYWRGNGGELDTLPPVYRWVAPSGAAVTACLMAEGYFAAAYLGDDPAVAAARLEKVVGKLGGDAVLLMNGIDHAPPDQHTGEAVAELARLTGWDVRRGLLEDYLAAVTPPEQSFTGQLVGGKLTNLLQGVWSTRTYLKRWNRLAETALIGWTEPFVAFAAALTGGAIPDERPAVRQAWRSVLVNQAHDSICGCSTDVVHQQMVSRYQSAVALADQTTTRVLERLSGIGARREVEWREGMDVAVWNPSPFPRTDVVRFSLDAHPLFMIGNPGDEIHPALLASLLAPGLTVDGAPARVVAVDDPGRVRLVPDQEVWDVEFVAADVPAFGWRRYRLGTGPRATVDVDDGTTIEVDALRLDAAADGTLTLRSGERSWAGLFTVEDGGDRGDTYDADVVDASVPTPAEVSITRSRFDTGVAELQIVRQFEIPDALTADRAARSETMTPVTVTTTARLAPGVDRVDVDVAVDNTARDHRLRLLFPVGATTQMAATTFDAVPRTNEKEPDDGWFQPSPTTFCVQGWVQAGGLTIGAPDLREGEITDAGALALTLVRSVAWLSQMDLHSRPIPAGPGMPTPDAQCLGRFETTVRVWPGEVPPSEIDAAERGLRAVAAGAEPLIAESLAAMTLEPRELALSACKPAEDQDGLVVRVLNTGDADATATLRFAADIDAVTAVRLDEGAIDERVDLDGRAVRFTVPAHATAGVKVRLQR